MIENKHPLKVTGFKILEDWGLMLVDEIDRSSEIFASDKPLWISKIEIKGVVDGTLSILAQDDFIATLAKNVLGSDESELSPDERTDVFKELGNILAGNFLTEAYGDDVMFELIRPQVAKASDEEASEFLECRVVFAFQADDTPVAITFNIDSEG